MPRGMSKCRICGKKVPSIFRPYHEKVACLKMRKERGDPDMIFREILPRVPIIEDPEDPAQKRLLEYVG